MSVNNDDEGENSGGVQEFFEFDEDGSSNQTKFELASQPPSDNPKRSSFVEKKRRISSENTGEVDSEIEENIVSISNLNNVKSTSDVAEEKYYDDIDKEWESEITPNELPNDEVELKVTQPQRHTSGSDFIHEEVEEELEFTSKSTPLRTEKEAAIVEVEIEEEITKPSPSPTRGDVVANVEMEDFPEIGDEIAPPKQIADLQARDNNASKAPSADLHSDLIQESRGSSGRCGSDSEHKKVKTSAAELADEAERQALAAGLAADKEKEDKVAALRLRAAKRQEDKEKREKKEFLKQQRKRAREAAAEGAEQEGAPEESEGVEGDAGNTEGKGEELKNKPFLPNINSRVKKTATNASKNRIASADTEDAEVKEASGWNDDVKADASRERQEAAVQQRLKDKEERNKLLRARRAKAQQAQAEGQGQEQGANGGAGGEDAPVESQSLLAPKPPAGRALTKQPASSSSSTAGNHKSRTDRMGRKVSGVSSASADDDPGRVVLPHLTNHPRSSPSPDPRAALHSLLQETEQMGADMDMNGIADDNKSYVSSSNKGRRKKPLYLRMIAKAQQQYLEDERQKVQHIYSLSLLVPQIFNFFIYSNHSMNCTLSRRRASSAATPPRRSFGRTGRSTTSWCAPSRRRGGAPWLRQRLPTPEL